MVSKSEAVDDTREMACRYSRQRFDDFAGRNPRLVQIKALKKGQTVVIQDPFPSWFAFVFEKWEIRGDYCVFKVIGDTDVMQLRPTEDMQIRGDYFLREELDIFAMHSDCHLIMVVD